MYVLLLANILLANILANNIISENGILLFLIYITFLAKFSNLR